MNISRRIISRMALRIAFLVVAFMCIGMGGFLFVNSNLGSDPFNVLGQGVSRWIPFQVGTINSILNFTCLLILFVFWRKHIKIATVISIFVIGFAINFWSMLFADLLQSLDLMFIAKACLVILGSAFVGFGVAIVQIIDLGMVPNDLLPLLIYRKIDRFQFRTVRIAYDLSQVVLGSLLGGIFGVGTILSALLMGPFIQFFLPNVDKMISYILGSLQEVSEQESLNTIESLACIPCEIDEVT